MLASKSKTITFKPDSILGQQYLPDLFKNKNFESKLSELLIKDISFTKNTLVPKIKDLRNKVNESVERASLKLESLNLKEITLLDKDEIVSGLITRGLVRDTGVKKSTSNPFFKDLDGSVLRNNLTLANGNFQDEIKEFLMNFTDAELQMIWKKNFTSVSELYKMLTLTYWTSEQLRVNTVLCLMIASLPKSNPSFVNYSNGKYLEVHNALQNKVINYNKMLNMFLDNTTKAGNVIITTDSKKVLVNHEVYQKFISAGGNVDTLIGVTYIKDHPKSIDKILSLRAEAGRVVNKLKTDLQIRNNSEIVRFKRIAMKQESMKHVEFEQERVYKFIDNLKDSEFNNLNSICTRLVAGVVFENSNGLMFLKHMNRYVKETEGITLEQAATYATVELVMSFLLNNVQVEG